MKIILEPTVTVVAATQFFGHPTYEIPDDGTDIEKLGSYAAKSCYHSFGKDGRSNLDNQKQIMSSAHGSVLEHGVVSLFIEGITRACSLEINRHRNIAISQRSTRYTNEDDAAIVLEPYYAELFKKYLPLPLLKDQMFIPNSSDNVEEVILCNFLNTSEEAFEVYTNQVETLINLNPENLKGTDLRKYARGKARNLLPHGLETQATYTMNFRTLRWFVEARSSRFAEAEIRRLADKVLEAVRPLAPAYFQDFTSELFQGIPEYKSAYGKI